MSNQTISIIRKATQPRAQYNIITFDTHERYQTMMCKTGHNFYSFQYDGCKKWVDDYAPKPSNYYTLPQNSIVNGIDFDFIVAQSRFGQLQIAKQIQLMFRIPIISLEHTLPIPNWTNQQLEELRSLTGDMNVFISEYSVAKWGISSAQVIHHGVDCETFKSTCEPRERKILGVVNDFKNRDYCCNYSGWERITKSLPTTIVGTSDDPLFSKPASSVEELVSIYSRATPFLNTSTVSPVPTSLLEAMACGCAVVTTATGMIPDIVKDGINGFISNDEAVLRQRVEYLLNEATDEEIKRLGDAARETILTNFSEQRFIDNWNTVFDTAYGVKK